MYAKSSIYINNRKEYGYENNIDHTRRKDIVKQNIIRINDLIGKNKVVGVKNLPYLNMNNFP